MKTITIYELLGLVKDGKAPKKIKITGTIYEYDEEYKFYFTKTKEGNVALGGKRNEINLIYNFNVDNVEIIEEKKIPEKIQTIGSKWYSDYIESYIDEEDKYSCYDELLMNKINEILDYLERKEKGE